MVLKVNFVEDCISYTHVCNESVCGKDGTEYGVSRMATRDRNGTVTFDKIIEIKGLEENK